MKLDRKIDSSVTNRTAAKNFKRILASMPPGSLSKNSTGDGNGPLCPKESAERGNLTPPHCLAGMIRIRMFDQDDVLGSYIHTSTAIRSE